MITAEVQKGHNYYHCTKKSKVVKCFQQNYLREENLDNQLTTLIKKYSLRKDWAKKMLIRSAMEEKNIAQSCLDVTSVKRKEIESINLKLQFLLDSYLDQIIDKQTYQEKKFELVGKKKTFEEQIFTNQQHQGSWLEPMRQWINEAKGCDKVALGTNKQAKKVLASKIFGSNLYMEDKNVRGIAQNAWSALCADPPSRKWERDTGVEPVFLPWEGSVRPLN